VRSTIKIAFFTRIALDMIEELTIMTQLSEPSTTEIGAFALAEFLRYYDLSDQFPEFRVESVIRSNIDPNEWIVTFVLHCYPSEWGSWSAEVLHLPSGNLTASHLYSFDEESPFIHADWRDALPISLRELLQMSKSNLAG